MAERGISEQRARQHEALVLRLEALLADVRRLAARAPEGLVSDPLRAAAEGLLYEADGFGGRHQRLAERARSRSIGQSGKEERLAERARLRSIGQSGKEDRSAGVRKSVGAPPTLGALLVELGQARARLETFELIHSGWSGRHKAFCWRTQREALPIARLRPALADDDQQERRAGERMRKALLRRFKARVEEAYERGYADARKGKPPPAEMP